jgi:hypothetical protein
MAARQAAAADAASGQTWFATLRCLDRCPALSRKQQLGLFLFLSPLLGIGIFAFQTINVIGYFKNPDAPFVPELRPVSFFGQPFNYFTVIVGYMALYQARLLDLH